MVQTGQRRTKVKIDVPMDRFATLPNGAQANIDSSFSRFSAELKPLVAAKYPETDPEIWMSHLGVRTMVYFHPSLSSAREDQMRAEIETIVDDVLQRGTFWVAP